ncbi:MAG TPA: hypothetical protein VGI44_20295, partial [Acidimicrobiales bacterium]
MHGSQIGALSSQAGLTQAVRLTVKPVTRSGTMLRRPTVESTSGPVPIPIPAPGPVPIPIPGLFLFLSTGANP